MALPDLTERQREVLRRTLAPHAARIDRVGVFGSRATGRARPNSDVDLVLYGDGVDAALVDRLWTAFAESTLPVAVDVVADHLVRHPGLRAHIRDVAVTLFTRDDLRGPETPDPTRSTVTSTG